MKYLYMNKYFPILIIFLCFSLIPVANAETLPSWIKNTAGWWATDLISESEFIIAAQCHRVGFLGYNPYIFHILNFQSL